MSFQCLFETILLLLLLNLILENYYGVEGMNYNQAWNQKDMDLVKKLKILNKPHVKSIQTEPGDIYDCINIYKQPAFDHPLLRNYKIQMKSNVIQGEKIDETVFNEVSSAVRSKLEGCPSETVPIRRTTKEELLNAKHFSNWIKRSHHVSVQPLAEKVYYGGKARISVVNPRVDPDKFSTAQIWIQNGPAEELNSIEFGWAVYPELFGDNKTRVFGLWTADGFKDTGCYNTLCPGFVQIHPNYSFGEYLEPGTYGGTQLVMDFAVRRDPKTGNWWFINGIEKAEIGYWPKEIFTHLANNASVIRYGGVAGADLGEPTPPMGYGYVAGLLAKYTTNMRFMKVVDDRGDYWNFNTLKTQYSYTAKGSCYNLIFPGRDIFNGIMVFFGGPGGNCPY